MPNIIEITDFDMPELHIYTKLSEVQLLHFFEPHGGLFIAESQKVIERALNFGCQPYSMLLEQKHLYGEAKELVKRCSDIPIYAADSKLLAQLKGFSLTRGALCAMHRPKLPNMEAVCKEVRRIAVLEHIVNPTNIGAIFRSAAALHIDAVLLTPDCCDPLYRRAIRVSMGTVFQVPWAYLGNADETWPEPAINKLHSMGFKTAAMALKQDSVSIDNKALMAEEKLAVVLGTEGDGLASKTIADCDYTVMIPMAHEVDSLNVAAASAVAFWQLGNK